MKKYEELTEWEQHLVTQARDYYGSAVRDNSIECLIQIGLALEDGEDDETVSLASYISDYANEELRRKHKITQKVILDAMEAFRGGAR